MDFKDFDGRNDEKKFIDLSQDRNFYIKKNEIWFVKLGQNIGMEEDGKVNFLRPVFVVKKVGNLFFTVAMTSHGKQNSWFYFKLKDFILYNPKYKNSSYVILSQVKVLDKKRFIKKIGIVSVGESEILKNKLKTVLF